jgi:hypothetical protein
MSHSSFVVGSLLVRRQTHYRRGFGQIHGRRGSRSSASVGHGLGESSWVVHVAWVFLCLGISHFDLMWLCSFSFFAFDEVSCGNWML